MKKSKALSFSARLFNLSVPWEIELRCRILDLESRDSANSISPSAAGGVPRDSFSKRRQRLYIVMSGVANANRKEAKIH